MLRCFETVVRCGSLIEAAETLGRTPSAVSMMLKQFEENVGSSLFETARKSRLTPFGELIYAEARRALTSFDHTVEVIQSLSLGREGFLRLAVTPSIANNVLPGLIKAFAISHPKVRIDVRDMDSPSVQHELEMERADIGIASVSPIAGMKRRILFSDDFGVVCAADDPLTKVTADLTWKSIADCDFISNGLCRLIDDDEFRPILNASCLSVPNTVSLLALVRAKVGITLLPRQAVPVDDGSLRFLPIIDCKAERNVYVVSKPNRMLLPAARAFLAKIDAMKLSIT